MEHGDEYNATQSPHMSLHNKWWSVVMKLVNNGIIRGHLLPGVVCSVVSVCVCVCVCEPHEQFSCQLH